MQLATWRSSRRPGAVVVVAPLKLVDGTGTPTRVLALV
jgi:kynurenine formamidase